MPRFAANLTMLYNESPFLDRFKAAAADGFKAVEYLFPYDFSAQELVARLRDHGLEQVLFNAPPGDWSTGERGMACIPGRESEFRSGFAKALEYAGHLACPRIHVMAGITPRGVDATLLLKTYESNLTWAAELAKSSGRDVLIEPINLRDMPGYFLSRQDAAHEVVRRIGATNLKVQMDLYHCQVTHGDLATQLRKWLPTGKVGHIQIAGAPMRHEPDLGEVNYEYLFGVIDELSVSDGWTGWVGCEYRPQRGTVAGATSAGLGWLKRATGQ